MNTMKHTAILLILNLLMSCVSEPENRSDAAEIIKSDSLFLFTKNKSMVPFGYQNGGDWTWFGGRMIQQLIRYGFVDEAFEQILPMVKRVKENDGFYEWYTIDNEPKGSGTFRGSAGVLYKAIMMFEELEKTGKQ